MELNSNTRSIAGEHIQGASLRTISDDPNTRI